MAPIECAEFQKTVSEYLIRHQSILDLLSKLVVSSGHVNRAVSKSVTSCGCLKIKAEKSRFPADAAFSDLKDFLSSHIEGQLCENCREAIISEMGKNLFYFTALCNTLGISLEEVMKKENDKVTTLGRYNLT